MSIDEPAARALALKLLQIFYAREPEESAITLAVSIIRDDFFRYDRDAIPQEITLRNHFAAAALTGAMTTVSGLGTVAKEIRTRELEALAGLLYEVADAMVAAGLKP